MTKNREHIALSAYLNLLDRKGFSKSALRQREVTILKLIPFIERISTDGLAFRAAVEAFFKKLDSAQIAASLPVVREYFSFWADDIKAIVAMNQDNAFEPTSLEWKLQESDAKELWGSLDEMSLTSSEIEPLETYENALRESGADDFFVATCKKIVKQLLLMLRSAPHKQPMVYRMAVDANKSLFNSEEAYKMFLRVGREFYYFWKDDLNARNQMQLAYA